MAKYQFYTEIKNNAEFIEFVKNEFNRDVSEIRDYELAAMFYKFKSHVNDIDENDEKFLSEVEKMSSTEELDNLTEAHFPNKKYSELSPENKAFIAVEKYETKDQNVTLEDIKSYLRAQSEDFGIKDVESKDGFSSKEDVYEAFHELADKHQYKTSQEDFNTFMLRKEAFLKDKTPEDKAEVENQLNRFLNNQDQEKMYFGSEFYTINDDFRKMYKQAEKVEEIPEEIKVEPVVEKEEPQTEIKEEPQTEIKEDILPPRNETPLIKETEEFRWRSLNSDDNEFLLDKMRLTALYDMEKVSDEEIADLTPEKAIEVLNDKLPKLSDKELAEYESVLTDKMLSNEEVLNLMPPSMLAKKYVELEEQASKEKDEDQKNDIEAKKSVIGRRMDELTEMLVKEGKTNDDLYFADVTNIADVHNGYMKMFDAMDKDWRDSDNTTPEAQKMRQGASMLDAEFEKYQEQWNLQNIQEENAEELQERFADLNKKLEGVELDGETAQLVSNFKFLDAEGNVEPQFVNEKGEVSDVYSEGAKVIEGSKLDTAIRLAKQNILLENLGTETEFTPELLQAQLAEKLPETLYALHVTNEVQKGVLENPKQFTDKKYLDEFMQNLSNTNKPMAISDVAFAAGVDNAVNATAGYAETLAQKIGRDKPVVSSVFEPIKDVDKRTEDRFENKTSKKAARIEMLKRTVKGAVSAFVVSGAITTLGTMAAADASLTASTMGLNKVAGMAIGSALAVGMTIKQIHSWRKQQKKEGKPAGLKAFLKNRKMVMTVATTAMGAAALGFAATGNPSVASALGIGALAVGTTNGVISNYGDSRKAGLGKFESAGWAAVQALANVAGAMGGRVTANMAIDAYNQAHPNNELFQHKEVVGQKEVQDRVETQYKEGVTERAHQTVSKWYAGHEDLLQQRVDEVNAYNQAHGTNIDPYRYLMAAHDAGAQAPDNMMLHNQGAPNVASHGNHMVLGAGWSQETGISQQEVSNLAHSITADGHVNLSPESISAFQQIDSHINIYNQVGYVEGAPYQNDGVLQSNASQNDASRFVQDAKGDRYTTYADGDSVYEQKVITHKEDVIGLVKNENQNAGLGMFGIMGNYLGVKKLKERAGALLDRILKRDTEPTDKTQPEDKTPNRPNKEKDEDKKPSTVDVEPNHPQTEEVLIVDGETQSSSNNEKIDALRRRLENQHSEAESKTTEGTIAQNDKAANAPIISQKGQER